MSVKDTFQIPDSLLQDTIFNLNLKQDLSGKSVPELRILRSCIFARHGYCFMEADLFPLFGLLPEVVVQGSI